MKDDQKIDLAILSALNLIGIFVNLHFFSASAQELLNASSHVFRQMYWGEWYTASKSNQKILLLIMHKCMQPVTVTFSTVFSMSLETHYTVRLTHERPYSGVSSCILILNYLRFWRLRCLTLRYFIRYNDQCNFSSKRTRLFDLVTTGT
ncbi:uncharacterized protein LOC143212621 [Lasioglossum baleicum]|uniref:uncharacterized protein LOC143212621 n=1 Tax=Lasioglossum baleicum TaxID=434251 RepID=UPI003FCCB2CE